LTVMGSVVAVILW